VFTKIDKGVICNKTDTAGKKIYTKDMIETAIQAYLKTAPIGDRTRELYQHYLMAFAEWIYANDLDPEQVNLLNVTDYFDSHPTWSASTKHTAAATIREFYRYQFGKQHPVTLVKIKRVDPGPQRTLNEEELTALLGQIDTSTEQGVRDMAIVTLLVDTGLRASELCGIEMRRLDIKNKKLTVKIKGGSFGEAVFFEYTQHCLINWLTVRPLVADPENPFVFCSLKGKTPGQQFTRYGLRNFLNTLSRKAGIEVCSTHAMRRTFATLATEHGAPTRLVQVAGRWKSIRMVEVYTQRVNPEKIAPFSPVNHIMGMRQDPK
jgi:site-specific recombinase XerD